MGGEFETLIFAQEARGRPPKSDHKVFPGGHMTRGVSRTAIVILIKNRAETLLGRKFVKGKMLNPSVCLCFAQRVDSRWNIFSSPL